jgi:glycine/D-amino acid oxidase-like deaminating enzyme
MRDPDADARNALRLIGPDPQNWVPDRPGIDHNVVIVGGGQSGSAFAFALRRAGIGKVSVIDMAEDKARAGVWLNAARMNVLRTPKTLPGPEYGIAALSFQAWYEARHGEAAYTEIERIPRADWAEYLAWYRRFSASRSAIAPGCGASSRRTGISACISSSMARPNSRQRGK